MSAWNAAPDGVALRVKAQPRARRPGVGGLAPGADGPRLRVAVTEAAEDGQANAAVRSALAEALHVPQSAVALRQGASSRQKSFHVAGDAAALIARLEALA
ncbi:DUF167 domain-containing protein [Plastoroseomonas arctica]|uniref:UPF0235 protein GXW79_03435 n=1 Tax=Plastoroseomonas arctica TaxID=1509237 RepID=A0AAF1JUT2_9PROT|nr:DUF167 domain-containing protein [Plastoroseomonas arctica]MBR0654127.1 DUF167 domain-containing protein [Plastoroseomonas arctica]